MTNTCDNVADNCSQIINWMNSQSQKRKETSIQNSSRCDHYLYLIFLHNKIFMLNSPNLLDSWTRGAITVRMSTISTISTVSPTTKTNSRWEAKAKGFFQFQPFVYFALKSQNLLGFNTSFGNNSMNCWNIMKATTWTQFHPLFVIVSSSEGMNFKIAKVNIQIFTERRPVLHWVSVLCVVERCYRCCIGTKYKMWWRVPTSHHAALSW